MLVKFQANQMKIDNFRNLADVDLLVYIDLKIRGGWIQWPDMQILFKFQVNQMFIENFRKLAYVDLLAFVDLKHRWRLNSQWPDMQILFKFEVNRMKIEEFWNLKKFLTFNLWWPFDLKNKSLFFWTTNSTICGFREDWFEIVTRRCSKVSRQTNNQTQMQDPLLWREQQTKLTQHIAKLSLFTYKKNN